MCRFGEWGMTMKRSLLQAKRPKRSRRRSDFAAELREKISSQTARVGVVGLGYVGLPLAVEFARAGFRVTGFDLDAEKVRILAEGGSYIGDVPAAEVRAERDAGRLEATTDFGALSAIDVIHVCVPTPLTKTKEPDAYFIV